MVHINKNAIGKPNISFSKKAADQLHLILKHDFTARDKYLRMAISGKGCHGFDYQVGFSSKRKDDVVVSTKGINTEILMDPFSAYYLQNATVDYVQDFDNNVEGFTVINHNQEEYKGKFWRKNTDLIPPTLS